MTKILIVDDEPDLISIMKLQLENKGYTIISAQDGEEGLKKAKEEKPDIILLDLLLPKISGYEVCRMLKEDAKYKHIPIILISGVAKEKELDIAKKNGADSFLTKPFELDEVIELIKKFVK